MLANLPVELQFLNDLLGDRRQQYRTAEWLKSAFDDDVWSCDFRGAYSFEIDFRVLLADGALLTAPRHSELLEIFKYWLCLQTHMDTTGGRPLKQQVAYTRVAKTLHIVDYLLLNAEHLGLHKYGLRCLTENDIMEMFASIASSKEVAISIYGWPTYLTDFLKSKAETVTDFEVEECLRQVPGISEVITDVEGGLLDLDEKSIVKAKVWLWNSDYYRRYRVSNGFEYTPNTNKLSELIYANTLRGKCAKPVPVELCIEPIDIYQRECDAVPPWTNYEDAVSSKTLSSYIRVVRSLGLLSGLNLGIPTKTLSVLDMTDIGQSLELKRIGRFRTLPQEVVLKSLKDSIEFALSYGDDLVSSFLAIARASAEMGISCSSYAKTHGISHLLAPSIKMAGVTHWNLFDYFRGSSGSNISVLKRVPRREYYSALRLNVGFLELIKVLYGSVQICVGTLMARRSGELMDLIAGECIDKSGTHLVFENRKTGEADEREKEARPIPQVAVRMIRMLERLQAGLAEIGVIHKPYNLFAYPRASGLGLVSKKSMRFNSCLDLFCDYTEVKVTASGERYYIRQHPLRRFFAMLFFWGNSFGGMDTLRWFLCHSDLEHLYHYITESTPGEVLKHVKVDYAIAQAKADTDAAANLSDLLQEHFGIREFSVLDDVELEDFIAELVEEGILSVEPEFFKTAKGESYRILIQVRPKERALEIR